MKKAMLNNDDLKEEVMGRSFVICAPTVLAENHLSWLMESLKERMNKGGHASDEDMASFMKILDEFSDMPPELDLNPSYYKFALRMSKGHSECQAKELHKVSAEMRKTREDYEQLEEECVDLRRRSDGGRRTEETPEAFNPASSEDEHPEGPFYITNRK